MCWIYRHSRLLILLEGFEFHILSVHTFRLRATLLLAKSTKKQSYHDSTYK